MASIPAKVITAAKPHITKFLFYAKTELTPPKPSDVPAIISGFGRIIGGMKSGAWKKLTVKDAVRNLMVATEVGCWFFIGECIGKRHLVGYKLS